MKIPKKNILIVILLLAIILIGLLMLTQNINKQNTLPPIQSFSPLPQATFAPTSAPVPTELEQEKISQENYAKSRQEFLADKPWISQLPLKSGNYFISFDPENDTLFVTLYYASEGDQQEQVTKAKDEAIKAMKSAGIDTEKQKIQYSEVLFK